jgi:trigger factor
MADDATTTATATAEENTGKLEQTVDIRDAGPCKKHVTITIDRNVIDDRFKEKFKEILQDRSTALPGFRPGKAPKKIVERKYHSVVKEEVRRELLMASLQQLAEDSAISPLAPPDLKADQLILPDEGPFIYEFDVEVRPEFDLPDLKAIKLKKLVHKFTDEEINREKTRILSEAGKIEAKDNPVVEHGDVVIGTLNVTHDGKELKKDHQFGLRVEKRVAFQDAVAEKFEDQIKGAKEGDTREIDITLGENVADQTLKGQVIKGKVKISSVRGFNIPAITPELLDSFGVRNEEQLSELIHTSLERQLEYHQRQTSRTQILSHVIKNVKWDLPQDLIVRQATRTLQRRVMEMRSAGMDDNQIEGRMALLRQNAIQSTTVALMEHFILQKIAEDHKIEIEDADIDAEIARIASQSGESFRKLKAQMEREDQLEALATELLERKALDTVLNNAEYEDEEFTPSNEQSDLATINAQIVPGELVAPSAPAVESAEPTQS